MKKITYIFSIVVFILGFLYVISGINFYFNSDKTTNKLLKIPTNVVSENKFLLKNSEFSEKNNFLYNLNSVKLEELFSDNLSQNDSIKKYFLKEFLLGVFFIILGFLGIKKFSNH